jgi:hypothetical protein
VIEAEDRVVVIDRLGVPRACADETPEGLLVTGVLTTGVPKA